MPITPNRNVRVDDELWERIEAIAVRHRRGTSQEVRIALEQYADACDAEDALTAT